jgi:hypothetical protein
MLVGFAVAGWITDNYKMLDGTTNWQMVWIIPAGIPRIFYYLHLFDSEKRKEIKLFNKIIMSSNLSRRSVLKGIIAGTVTMGIPIFFLILH